MTSNAMIPTRHVSPTRVVVVTLGLIGLGAGAGAVAGALAVAAWLGITVGVKAAFDLAAWAVAGGVGGVLGTALGGVLGVQFLGGWWLAGPLCGFGLATGRLWLLARRARTG